MSDEILESQLKAVQWLNRVVKSKTEEQLSLQDKKGLLILGRLLTMLANDCANTRKLGKELREISAQGVSTENMQRLYKLLSCPID